MTIGIYKLSFNNDKLMYIGQSTNIEKRYIQHCSKLKTQKASYKLQAAYNLYNKPLLYILKECEIFELDKYEIQYINLFDSIDSGLNIASGGYSTFIAQGAEHTNALYKEEDYFNVLYFLTQPSYSIKDIEKLTGVSKYVISHIASLEGHKWLEEKYPDLYKEIVLIKEAKAKGLLSDRGVINSKVLSPNGEIFEILHQTNFAKEHGLLQPKLNQVLHGKRKSHKGWKLVE